LLNLCAVTSLLAIFTLVLTSSQASPLSAAAIPSDDKSIEHVLNRIGYGPRPGDIEKVRRGGLSSYIEQQLHPERINDSAVEARLERLKTLDMSTEEIARQYFLPALMERRQQKREQAENPPPPDPNGAGAPEAPGPAPIPGTPPRSRQASEAFMKQRQVMGELSEQKILRAVYSARQLQEVLVDFWFNHFNVFAGKGPDRVMLTEYERETIRPYVLGNFRDLLGATAHSPAMLFYLDNWMSAGQTQTRQGQQRRATGLNENYARELMELHTLGVDAGYTQQDIVEVARAFTGWTITQPRQGGGYRFDPRRHDDGEKRVLGHTIEAGGGEHDGEQVLDLLARHPSTSKFIASKLARRFVGDEPPASLVDRAVARFRETDGNLREVVRTIITSPEFFSADAHRAKVKTPFEFVASALRASSAQIQHGRGLVRSLQELGMPLYFSQPPTGYADTADAWVNTGGLVNRMNFALSLVENRVPGVRVEPGPVTALMLGGSDFQRR
jgi:uncharacterized protein (DUF1800 family)